MFYCLSIFEKPQSSANFNKFYQFFKSNFLNPKCAYSSISYTKFYPFLPTFILLLRNFTTFQQIPTFTNFYNLPQPFIKFYSYFVPTFILLWPIFTTFHLYHLSPTFITFHQLLLTFILLSALPNNFVILIFLLKMFAIKIYQVLLQRM